MAPLGLQRRSDSGCPLSSLCPRLQEIDTCIVQAKERSYETVLSFGKRGLNIAATAAVQAATKVRGPQPSSSPHIPSVLFGQV